LLELMARNCSSKPSMPTLPLCDHHRRREEELALELERELERETVPDNLEEAIVVEVEAPVLPTSLRRRLKIEAAYQKQNLELDSPENMLCLWRKGRTEDSSSSLRSN
jgi:hypothetical protein